MMIRLVMFLLLTALILTGASAFVQRGWQVTHAADPAAKLTRAEPVAIIASLYAWATSTPESDVPALVKQFSQQAPWLPTTSIHEAGIELAGAVTTALHSDAVTGATAWVKGSASQVAAYVGLGGSAPAPAPVAVATPAPAPAAKPVAAAAPTPAPAPVASSAPVVVAQAPAVAPAPVPPARTVQTIPTRPLAAAVAPAPAELWSTGTWTLTQKGCAIGGLAGTGASLVIGPAELAAWVTGAAVLPATLRVVGTVIGAALVTGCATGALVAPVVIK